MENFKLFGPRRACRETEFDLPGSASRLLALCPRRSLSSAFVDSSHDAISSFLENASTFRRASFEEIGIERVACLRARIPRMQSFVAEPGLVTADTFVLIVYSLIIWVSCEWITRCLGPLWSRFLG